MNTRSIALLSTLLLAAPGVGSAQETITVAAFGGQYQKQTGDAWFRPAAQKLGLRLSMDIVGTAADVRAHVQGGKTNWDVVLLAGSSCATVAREKLVQPLDYSVIDAAGIPAHMVTERTVGVLQYSTVLAWNKEQLKGKEPKSWADFWDVKAFPGPRGFDARATFSLEIATMADGVPPAQVYPIDVDRAFRKIAELRPHIATYYANGAVAVQLLKDGEVDMLPLFENRVHELIRDGFPLAFTLNQAIVDINCLVVPNGTPKRDLAMRMIAEIVKPEMNARIAQTSDMSPTNARIFELGLIPAERAQKLSSLPANMTNQLVLDANWWTPVLSELNQRYKALISAR
ncbi:ABC transporter substrate-binding protein [Allostella vacuolata]|nr:ABC transporter substrate-binding protein [Stella vacuolata]